MSRRTHQKAIAKLEAIYARLPRVACRGLCSIACGPLPMSELEAERMRRADPGRRLPMVVARDGNGFSEMSCVYLTRANRCGVYDVRPLICRVWGTVKRLSCMHGCIPDRWLSDHEFVAIAQAVERVGGPTVLSSLGPLAAGRSFFELDTTTVPPEEAEALAEITRSVRALHGGRVVGVSRTATAPEWIDLDERDDE